MSLLVTVLIFAMLIVGCSSKKTMTFAEIFPGKDKTTKVTSIHIQTNSGHSRIIKSPIKIKEWLEKVKHIQIVQDENQEARTGYLYFVNMRKATIYSKTFYQYKFYLNSWWHI